MSAAADHGGGAAFAQPLTLGDAITAMGLPGAIALAGGTDVWPALGERPVRGTLVDLTRLAELRGIGFDGTHWRFGACTTWSDVVAATLPAGFHGLQAAAAEVGAIQIQNAGTIAGNLCTASPAADSVPPLLTLGALVDLAGPNGPRSLPLADFITGVRQTALLPGEIVTAIRVPSLDPEATSAFLKLGARKYLVISIAMVAACLTVRGGHVQEAAVAVGSCSKVAQRLTALEGDLIGAPAATVAALVTPSHMAPLAPIDDVRGSAIYRLDAAAELTRRVIQAAATPQAPAQGEAA